MTSAQRPGAARAWQQDFRRFWAGESASLVGSQVLALAMPLTAVMTLGATPAQLGLLGVATYLPYLLVGVPAGLLVDRWQRRRVLIAANLVQCLAIGAIPLLASRRSLTLAALLALAFVAGVGRVVFGVAYRSYLPTVVPREHLGHANARLTLSESAAEILGPGLGGLLVQALGAPLALLVDAVSYLASASGYLAVKAREEPLAPDPTPLGRRIAAGFRLILGHATLRAFLGEAATYNLCWQLVNTVLVLFAVRTLGLSAGTLGLTLSVGAVGAVAGTLATTRAARRWGLGHTLVAAAVLGDVAPLLLPAAQPGAWAAPLLALAFFVQGAGITACNVQTMSVRQAMIPPALLGRANAAYLLLAQGATPVGAVVGGWLATATSIRTALLVGALGLLTTSLFLIASPVRRLHSLADVRPVGA